MNEEDRWPSFWRGPFSFPRRTFRKMDDLMGDVFEGFGRLPTMLYGPRSTDIYEKDGNLVYELELPGVDKEDIKLKVEESRLIVTGEKKREERVEKENYLSMGRSYGAFQRVLPLPEKVGDTDKIKAEFKRGVLKITVPLTESIKKKGTDIEIE